MPFTARGKWEREVFGIRVKALCKPPVFNYIHSLVFLRGYVSGKGKAGVPVTLG
jgi:hypothetical protein